MYQICIRHRHNIFIISPCTNKFMSMKKVEYRVMEEIPKLLFRHPSLAPNSLLYACYVQGTFKDIISFTPHPGR